MKNTILIILLIGILVLGFLFFKEKNSNDTNVNPWPETEPATQTNNNYPTQNNSTPTNNNQTNTNNNPVTPASSSNVKTYSGNGFKIDYPKDVVVTEEEAEGGPYKVVYFTDNAIVMYIWNPDFHEQHAMSIDYELVGTKIANGNTFKVYSVYGETNNRFYLRSGNVAYEISFRDHSRMSLDSFDLLD